MKIINKIFNQVLLTTFFTLLAASYPQFSYANSNKYLSKWYEYKLQTTKPEIIDVLSIDEIVEDLVNNKSPIYSLIVDNNSLPHDTDVLEKLLGALKTNTTIKDLSFFNFSGQNIEKITNVLNNKVFSNNPDTYRQDHNWLISVNFTNNDNANVMIEESTAKEIGALIKKGLIKLNLSGNKINTDNLVSIVQELPGSKLTHLYLNKIKITRGGIHAFANTLRKENNKLAFLSLDQNNIESDDATQLFDAISKNNNLQSISLAENNIGGNKETMKAIRKIYKCHAMGGSNINLAKNNLVFTDIYELMSDSYDGYNCNPKPNLRLNLTENKIESDGAMTIAKSRYWLEENAIINLGGNNIDPDGIMKLVTTAYSQEQIDELDLRITDIKNLVVDVSEHSEL